MLGGTHFEPININTIATELGIIVHVASGCMGQGHQGHGHQGHGHQAGAWVKVIKVMVIKRVMFKFHDYSSLLRCYY